MKVLLHSGYDGTFRLYLHFLLLYYPTDNNDGPLLSFKAAPINIFYINNCSNEMCNAMSINRCLHMYESVGNSTTF